MVVYEAIIGFIYQGKLCGWCKRRMVREINESAEKNAQIFDIEENCVTRVIADAAAIISFSSLNEIFGFHLVVCKILACRCLSPPPVHMFT